MMNNKLFCLLCPIFGLKIKLEYEINLSLKRTASPRPTRISRIARWSIESESKSGSRVRIPKKKKKKVFAYVIVSVFILLLLLFFTKKMKNYYLYSKKLMTMLEVFNTLIRISKYISTIYFRFEYRRYIMKHTHCISKKSKQIACIIN